MKLDDRTLNILQHSHLFRAFSPQQFSELTSRAKLHPVAEGEFLFHQGELLEEIYICLEGCIKLFRLTPSGDEKIIDIITPGSSFAEAVAFMRGQRYPVCAVALRPGAVIGINAIQYLGFLSSSPELCLNLLALLSRRMHWLLNEVDRLTLHNATFRLVAYLLEAREHNSSGNSIYLSAPKHIIASRLSIKPETFSRILKRLADKELIAVHDSCVDLLDVAGLEAIVHAEL